MAPRPRRAGRAPTQLREIADEIPPPPAASRARRGAATSRTTCPTSTPCRRCCAMTLIADEDAAFRKYLAMPLAAQGFTIYEAADGLRRLAARRAEPPLGDPRRHLDARGGRFRVLPPGAQPPAARPHADPLHLGVGQVQGALPRVADRCRRLPVEEHADPRAAHADPAAHDALLRPRRFRRAQAGHDRGRGGLPGPHRDVRRAGAPADVQPGASHRPLHRARRRRGEHGDGHGLPRGRHHLRRGGNEPAGPTASTPSSPGRGAASSSPRATRARASRSPRASSTSSSRAAACSTSHASRGETRPERPRPTLRRT